MARASTVAVAAIGLLSGTVIAQQEPAVQLTITVALVDDSGSPAPVAHHALLVSDSPPSTAPQHVVTDADGTTRVNLRPGTYIVESDQPVAFRGQAYRWIQPVVVAAEGDNVLRLTADNARVEAATIGSTGGAEDEDQDETDPWDVLRRYEGSVVALWTPTTHASGFVVDERGLIATSRRALGGATTVEVQIDRDTKVAGAVLPTDPDRDVAMIRVNPGPVASIAPVPLDCETPPAGLVDGQEVFRIGLPLRGSRDLEFGDVRRTQGRPIAADFDLRVLSPGGPVFTEAGGVVGLTSVTSEALGDPFAEAPIVGRVPICAVMSSADDTLSSPPPGDEHLPVESATTISRDVLEDIVSRRLGSLNPDVVSSEGFDVTLLTPVHVYAELFDSSSPAMIFSNWSDYVRNLPPVLFIRVTPKQSESFWMRLARGAASTQGASIPPIMRFEPGFASLRALCDENEVTPVHPFKLVTRISETEAIHEGLYVFAPEAFGPQCARVTLALASEKEPEAIETVELEPSVIRRIQEDFRVLASGGRSSR